MSLTDLLYRMARASNTGRAATGGDMHRDIHELSVLAPTVRSLTVDRSAVEPSC